MAPQPTVEVDLERKEELILAKQLRACRVNILPRVGRVSLLSKIGSYTSKFNQIRSMH